LIHRIRHSWLALCLALSATLAHALVPAGYMLGRSGSAQHFGFMLCTGGMGTAALQAIDPAQTMPDHSGAHAIKACPFAVAAMPAVAGMALRLALTSLPGAPICHAGPRRAAASGGHRRPPATGPPQRR